MTVVRTSLGAIRGDVKHGVAAWRGIPYARPPLGELRFLPPGPVAPWTGEHDGTRYGPVAMQSREQRSAMMSGITDKMQMSEDCLSLNVFAPADHASGPPRPVLVWIHGGAFVMGAGSLPLYHGGTFAARHGLVVVTVNYRLGHLGLLYLGELFGERYAHGNVALLDQIAALTWVRDHVAAFGGDPGAVTVMGESAGAFSVAHLLAMPAARGLFQRAILQSGATALIPPARADATASARAALAELGVADLPSLLALPAERIVAAQAAASQARGLAAFSPCVDGVTVPKPPLQAVRAGSAAGVPVLLGSNRDEWALFDTFLGAQLTQTVVAQLRGRFGGLAELAHARYLEARADRSSERAWIDILGDLAFRIPMIRLAEEQSRHAPVYMYRFDLASKAFDGKLGAAHALELPFVWNRLDNPLSQLLLGGADPSAQSLALEMHDAWASFVRTGDPGGGWPRYDDVRRATRIFDRTSSIADDPDGLTRVIWPRV
ncbi:MAG: carboxylesterase/lipase family protein [Deltaproteobacteria bacterium]|nr:carboxylesterase/lipase family protein [Deltaproteobacteria bacterium]